MNRVMMDVLPTDWSPRKTSLYLARGASVPVVVVLLVGFLAVVAVGWAGRAGAEAFSLIVLFCLLVIEVNYN